MTDSADLVRRLRDGTDKLAYLDINPLCVEAADRIEQLEAQLAATAKAYGAAVEDYNDLLAARAEPVAEGGDWIDGVVLDIAELPDRHSPDVWPEAMLVTAEELRGIIKSHAPFAPPASALGGEPLQLEQVIRKVFSEACGAWSDVRMPYGHEKAGETDCERVSIAAEAEARCWVLIEKLADAGRTLGFREGVEAQLPDVEIVSDQVHAAWIGSKRAQGVESRKAEDGEELMVPYMQLSEKAKRLDRVTVEAVYAAIRGLRAGA